MAEVQTLSSDTITVELLPSLGGRAARIRAFGRDLLRRPASPDDHPYFWGWYSMAPWTNRVPGGRLDVPGGGVVQLTPNWEDGSALHGHTVTAPWSVLDVGVFEFAYAGAAAGAGGASAGGFPWAYTARQRWALSDDGAAVVQELSVRNDSSTAMPAGLGIHPWWVVDGGLEVHVPARVAYPCEGGLAVGPPSPTDSPPAGPVPWGVDQLFTDLAAQAVRLIWPAWGVEAELAFSSAADHVHVAAFERAAAVAVEPVTHAGDGHRRLRDSEPGAIHLLAPGDTLTVEYRLTARQPT